MPFPEQRPKGPLCLWGARRLLVPVKTDLMGNGVACAASVGDLTFVGRDASPFMRDIIEEVPFSLLLCYVLHFTPDADSPPSSFPSLFRIFHPLYLDTFHLL